MISRLPARRAGGSIDGQSAAISTSSLAARRRRIPLILGCTHARQWAEGAAGALGVADASAMQDEVDVEIIDAAGRELGLEDVVRGLGADARPDQAEAAGDAMDVGVDR